MIRWRVFAVAALLVVPLIALGIAGTYALWQHEHTVWLLWLFPSCWTLAWLLLRTRPGRKKGGLAHDRPLPMHWTPRDEAAYDLVRQQMQASMEIPAGELSKPQFYLQTALDLSLKIARHYHPQSADPVSSLTVVEVLAAAQLAVEDTAAWLHHNVPGSHLLTIRHWRALSQAPRWMQAASDVTWLISVLWNPVNLPRWLATRYATSSATKEIEAGVLGALYREFLHNVGWYCIEMNSGRLRGGVARNRAALRRLRSRRHAAAGSPAPSAGMPGGTPANHAAEGVEPGGSDRNDASDRQPSTVCVAVIGQVNAGKSSLINALLGENRARCDVLMTTTAIQRFRYDLPGSGDHLELLDTPGYGSAELTESQRRAIRDAWMQADLVLLVMDVTSPARAADWRTFDEATSWYSSVPDRKPPRVLGVLTHIDGLTPAMEWQPPYDWNRPLRLKEQNLRAAVDYTAQVFAGQLDAVIPVRTDVTRQPAYGVEEWLVPAIVALLPGAQASLVVRILLSESNAERLTQLVRQVRAGGIKLLGAMWKMHRGESP